jgi:1-pyrroline-5-carboxylate dehydrogenase
MAGNGIMAEKITYVTLLADESIHDKYEHALETVRKKLGQRHPMFIGEDALFTTTEFEVRSAIDSDIVVGYFQKGTEKDAQNAIEKAKAAFPDWSAMPWKKRVHIIQKVADALEKQKYTLAALITYEIGKNRYEALAEVFEAIDFLRYYADVYRQHNGYTQPTVSEVPGEHSQSVLKPHGVWAVISPFNFPIALAAGMASAALLTGNTVVLKPTSTAPFSGMKLYQAYINSGVPPGAVNVVTGPGKSFGEAIVGNPDLDGIAFTGSRNVGMWLYRSFSAKQPYPKPVILELGSKNPAIITAKANLESAVEGVVRAAFGFSGQKCSATSRIYVESAIADDFIALLRSRTEKITTGDPRKKEVFMGPVITEHAYKTFMDAVLQTKTDGGTIITGGEALKKGIFDRGYYVLPTIVTGLPQDHRLAKDELFVPFAIVDTVESLEEALVKANDTEYGLTAGIFSEKTGEVDYFFENIRFGVTYSNRKGGATTGAWPGAQPFGGWKGSGSTGRGGGGPYYLLNFLREQAQTRVRD